MAKRKKGAFFTVRRMKQLAIAAGVCFLLFLGYRFAPRLWSLLVPPENPVGFTIHGIDVSHHQGEIDWEKLAANRLDGSPLHFVFIKATEGETLADSRFAHNFHQAREHGMVRGAYHFFNPSAAPETQANHFIRRVHLEEGDLPPVLDIETIGKLTPDSLRRAALAWLQKVETAYNVAPIIYTYYKFKKDYLNTPDFDRYPHWIARYYVDSLRYEGDWHFWQHTDCGRLDGIKGRVDMNVYNGTLQDLRNLTIDTSENEK